MTEQKPIRILIAEDHTIVREVLNYLLARQQNIMVVASARSGREAIDLFRVHRPDVTLMDLRMPDIDGFSAIEAILRECGTANIVVLSNYDGEEEIKRALHAGARGYLSKDMSREQLLEAIHTVHAGKSFFPAPIIDKLAASLRSPALTSREVEILDLMKQGMSNLEIAEALFITEGTIKSHINNILKKLNAGDRTQAVMIALRQGIIRLQ